MSHSKSDDLGKLVVVYDGSNAVEVRKAFLHVAVGRNWIAYFLKNPGTKKTTIETQRLEPQLQAKSETVSDSSSSQADETERKELAHKEEVEKAEMTDLERQIALIERDLAQDGVRTFYDKNGDPEDGPRGMQRSMCWRFLMLAFRDHQELLEMVDAGDVFHFWIKVIMGVLASVPKAQMRVERSNFYNQYVTKSETYLEFLGRVKKLAKSIEPDRRISEKDVRDTILNGMSYHARWEAGNNPRPRLTPTRFYGFVERLESEERSRDAEYTMSEMDARFVQEDAKQRSEGHFRPQPARNAGGYHTGVQETRPKVNRVCWFFLQQSGCSRGDACNYYHVRGEPPEGVYPARKPGARWERQEKKQTETESDVVAMVADVVRTEEQEQDDTWGAAWLGMAECAGDKHDWRVLDCAAEAHMSKNMPKGIIGGPWRTQVNIMTAKSGGDASYKIG